MNLDLSPAEELGMVFARMSGLLLSRETVATALHLVTTLAAETVSRTAGAGVSLRDENGRRTSAAASDPLAERADRAQYDLDEGPCLHAWSHRETVRVDDVSAEARWPRWGARASELGVASCLSTPLVTGDSVLGAIKVYSREAHAYGDHDVRLLMLFASQAAVLIANVTSFERAQRLSEDLKGSLAARDTIATARGMVMARQGVDEESAFALLARQCQQEHTTMHEAAQKLLASAARRRR